MTTRIKKNTMAEQSLTLPWIDILQDAEDFLLALSLRVGLPVLQQMMAVEVEQWAGPKGRHDP